MSAAFPDESLATSADQSDKTSANPSNGRLYKPELFWCPKAPFRDFYLELILVQEYYIFAVSIQGKLRDFIDSNFTTDFSISYSGSYANWLKYDRKFKVSYLNIVQIWSKFFHKNIFQNNTIFSLVASPLDAINRERLRMR